MQHAIVLGGGIMGLCAARALRAAGHAVTLVDQDPLPNPRGASVDHHRLIRHAYGAARGYTRMVDDAYQAWEALFAEIGERPYVETGVLALSDIDDGWLAESRATLRGEGHAIEEIDPATLPSRYPWARPDAIAGAFRTPRGGVLLARRIVAALSRHLVASGIRALQARAVSVDPTRACVTLAGGETLTADALVVAAGPWAPRLLPGLAGRVTPSRQVVVDLEPPPALRAAWLEAPMLLDLAAEGGFYAVPPVAGTPLKVGDHRFSLTGDAEDGRDVTGAEREAILHLADRRLRDLSAYRVLGARACYYDAEAAECFVVEPLSDRCVVMSGFSGHGFKFGPALGNAVAAALDDPRLMAALPGWAAGRDAPVPGLLDARVPA